MQDDCFHAITSLSSRRISGSRFCQRWTARAIIRCHFQRRSRRAGGCGMNSLRQSAGIVFQKCWRPTKNPTTANRLRRKRRWPFGELATGGSSASAPLRRDNLRRPFARALSWWVSDLKPDPRAGDVARCWLQI